MAALLLGPVVRYVDAHSATVWVETDAACTVTVQVFVGDGDRDQVAASAPTFAVAGHHFALVVLGGLPAGTDAPYTVTLDGEQVWPMASGPLASYPPSRLRTSPAVGPVRMLIGSCRYASPAGTGAQSNTQAQSSGEAGSGQSRRQRLAQRLRRPKHYGRDCLDAVAQDLRERPTDAWPHLLLLIGDQVYADEVSDAVAERIRARRGTRSQPRREVADFEEYSWLYAESWADPPVRWLLSTVSSAMIFDDHDIHDDWNTSKAWRHEMGRQPWWRERVIGGLSSYFVYQHLGNLSPEELTTDPVAVQVLGLDEADRKPGQDVELVLRRLAVAADAEADGAKGYRWSHARTVGRTRVVVLDSRCGRILDDDSRRMLGEDEFSWAEDQMRSAPEFDHLVVATSLPWLLPPALQDVEGWNERVCADDAHPVRARIGEQARRGADLEHWAAFAASFDRLAQALRAAAGGADGGSGADRRRPATVSVVSGDVHHSYVGEALDEPVADAARARIYQITCSPLNNSVPLVMRLAFRAAWHPWAERGVRALLSRTAPVPPNRVTYRRLAGPVFGNAVASLQFDGPRAHLAIRSTEHSDADDLTEVVSLDL